MMKKIIAFMLCALIAVSTVVPAQADTKIALKNFSDAKGVEGLGTDFNNGVAYEILYKIKKGKTVTYNFSKDKNRALFARKSADASIIGANKISKHLFGKSISKKKAIQGDWSEDAPSTVLKTVIKKSSSSYVFKYNVVMISIDLKSGTRTRTKIGTMNLNVKKSKKAFYGYYVKKATVKAIKKL